MAEETETTRDFSINMQYVTQQAVLKRKSHSHLSVPQSPNPENNDLKHTYSSCSSSTNPQTLHTSDSITQIKSQTSPKPSNPEEDRPSGNGKPASHEEMASGYPGQKVEILYEGRKEKGMGWKVA